MGFGLFSGSCSLSGGVSKGMGWNKVIPYQIRLAPGKKNVGIDQARIWTKSSLNDDTFGDGKTAISLPKGEVFQN